MATIRARCFDCNHEVTADLETLPNACPKCGGHLSSGPQMFAVHDIVEDNGKSIRENNMEKRHGIAVGTLVEVKYDDWHGGGACSKVHARLWVIHLGRDCDGTPLYWLAKHRGADINDKASFHYHGIRGGYSEKSLMPVEVTPRLAEGYDALGWTDEELAALGRKDGR